jgi:tol-pal system protein YbgF
MTCDEVRDAFSDFYDGRLFGARLTEVTRHLDECSDCRAEWTTFSMTLQVVSRLGTAQPSPGFAARVRQQIEAPSWRKRLIHRLFVPVHVKVPIHAVALAILSFAGLMLFQRSPELRREGEVKLVPPASVARQAPPSGSLAPAPPIPEKPVRAKKAVKTPEATSMAERAEGGAVPPAASAPSPPLPAPLGKQEDMRPPTLLRQRSAPIPAPSQEATSSPAPTRPLAQGGAGRLSSLPSGSADELFSAAVSEYARQEYGRAIERFRAFIVTYPQDGRVADARFLLGEAYFSRQRYAEAVPEFETLVREYPDSRRIPAALYRQGLARLALGDRTGCRLLGEVVSRYPQTREAGSARESLTARCP